MSSVVLEALLRNEELVMRHVAHLHVFLHQVMEKSIHHAMRLIKRSTLNQDCPQRQVTLAVDDLCAGAAIFALLVVL